MWIEGKHFHYRTLLSAVLGSRSLFILCSFCSPTNCSLYFRLLSFFLKVPSSFSSPSSSLPRAFLKRFSLYRFDPRLDSLFSFFPIAHIYFTTVSRSHRAIFFPSIYSFTSNPGDIFRPLWRHLLFSIVVKIGSKSHPENVLFETISSICLAIRP